MALRTRRRRALVIVLVALAALVAAGGVSAYTFLTRDEPVVYGNIVEQYKYCLLYTSPSPRDRS